MTKPYAKPFNWVDDPIANTLLLDAFVAQPEFLSYPQSPEVARQIGAYLLTNSEHIVYATYSGPDLTGVILLTHVVPRVDARIHFLFLDKDLAGKRKLLQNFIGFCFTDLGFNRLSAEVPEGVRLERFLRKVLKFRLEGESRTRNPELPKSLSDNWVARQGSRRESAYFNGTAWTDIVLLRLLACEWVDGDKGGRPCQSEPSQAQPHQS